MQSQIVFTPAVECGPCNSSRYRENQYPKRLHPEENRLPAIGGIGQRALDSKDVRGNPLRDRPHRPQRTHSTVGSERNQKKAAGDLSSQAKKRQVQEEEPETDKCE